MDEQTVNPEVEAAPWLRVFLATCVFVYTLLIVIGLPTNLFVLMKMLRLRRQKPDVFRTGTGLCLMTMAVADIFSLLSIMFFMLLSAGIQMPHFVTERGFENLLCKVTSFTMGTATSIAIWSWLLMSILRWLALYHPLLHRTLYDLPSRLLATILVMSSLTNSWLVFSVEYEGEPVSKCTERYFFGSQKLMVFLHLIEMGWSFIVPIFVVIYLDTATLMSIPKLLRARYLHLVSQSGNSSRLKHVTTPRTKQELNFHQVSHSLACPNKDCQKCKKTLGRWLLIALADILLNTPENVQRLCQIFGILNENNTYSNGFLVFKNVADMMYYSQYSFNAFYLALFIYDKCTMGDQQRQQSPSAKLKVKARYLRLNRCSPPTIESFAINRDPKARRSTHFDSNIETLRCLPAEQV